MIRKLGTFYKKNFEIKQIRHNIRRIATNSPNTRTTEMEKYLEKIRMSSPKLSSEMKKTYDEFMSLPEFEKQKIYDKAGMTDLMNACPEFFQRHTNIHIIFLFFTLQMKSPSFEKMHDLMPLEDIGTNYTNFSMITDGIYGLPDWRVTFIGGNIDEYYRKSPEAVVSPWHDMCIEEKHESEPDFEDNSVKRVKMFITMPKGTIYKNRIVKDERMNPIRHFLNENGSVVRFKYPLNFNIGILPQTWVNKKCQCPISNIFYDNEPFTAIMINGAKKPLGNAIVRLLGMIGVIDGISFKMSWVFICCDLRDPFSGEIDTINDVEKWMPGRLNEIKKFLRTPYFDDNRFNLLYENGEIQNIENTYKILIQGHKQWHDLIRKDFPLDEIFYVHNPSVRTGELLKDEESPTHSDSFDYLLNLSPEDRALRRWADLDRKKAFYTEKYLRHRLRLEKRKNDLLCGALFRLDPQLAPVLLTKMEHVEAVDPPPSQTGAELLFEERENDISNKISAALEGAAKKKLKKVEGSKIGEGFNEKIGANFENFGKIGDKNGAFRKISAKNEFFGKISEKNEFFGKIGEKNEFFGKISEKNELFGKIGEKNDEIKKIEEINKEIFSEGEKGRNS